LPIAVNASAAATVAIAAIVVAVVVVIVNWRGTKGLVWGTRRSFLLAAAIVVMVVVGSWSLGHDSTIGILD
jgi:hypothetical protein